jgi:hypothetical protein
MKNSTRKREETLIGSDADALREDSRILSRQKHNPFMKNGEADVDAYLAFVEEFNALINHVSKPFRRIVDSVMII